MATFSLKYGDTRPILEVTLRNADGTIHDLTGSTSWKLLIRTRGSSYVSRDMVKEGLDTAGTLRYAWVPTDWTDEQNPDGVLPRPSESYPAEDYPMEYQVSAGSSVMTFPNQGTDTLRITGDIS